MSLLSAIGVTVPTRRFPPDYADGVRPSHHMSNTKTKFADPWPSFRFQPFFQLLSTPTWGAGPGNEGSAKATWLGHPCYLVEFPTPPGAARGVRIIFDPVSSKRCSPFQWLGPVRYIDPPCKIEEVPAVDAIVLSHRYTDTSVFVPLNNANYLSDVLRTPLSRFHELDWWEERLLQVPLPSNTDSPALNAEVRLSCTPSQHITGLSIFDRFRALWGSWVVDDLHSHKNLYFAGDTAYVPYVTGKTRTRLPFALRSQR